MRYVLSFRSADLDAATMCRVILAETGWSVSQLASFADGKRGEGNEGKRSGVFSFSLEGDGHK